jgi:signal transduction histidine kinase
LLLRHRRQRRRRRHVHRRQVFIQPILATAAIVYVTVRRSLRDATFREQRELSRRIADRVAASIENAHRGLAALRTERRFQNRTPKENIASLRHFLEAYPDLLDASVFDGQGRGLVRVSRRNGKLVWGKEPSSRAGRPEFLRAAEGHRYTSPVFFTARDRVPQVLLSVPSGAGRGVLVARLNLAGLWDLVGESAGPFSQAFVIDGEGNLVAHPDHARVLAHENWAERSVVRIFLEDSSGGQGYFMDQGVGSSRTLAVFHRIPGLGWGAFVETPYRDVLAPVRSLGTKVLATALGLGILFWSIGFSLVNKILRPLGVLQEGIQRIGRGEMSHRIDLRTGDELQRVAETLNAMAQSLTDIDQTKRDLTHMIVHDLKNPLSATLGSIDYVLHLAKDSMDPDQRKLLTLGAKSGRGLLRLIQTLLDVAKMEEGKLEIRPESFSLLELAGQCVDDLEAQILKENKVISVEVDHNLPKAWADRDLVHRVLANLLTNALKHTPAKTEISIHVRLDGDPASLVVSVQDNGEGVPADFKDRIFEKFSQAEGKRRNHRVGSGLGLTFCKLAVETHGGKIWVESEPGRGSEFFFSLPLPKPIDVIDLPASPSSQQKEPVASLPA